MERGETLETKGLEMAFPSFLVQHFHISVVLSYGLSILLVWGFFLSLITLL